MWTGKTLASLTTSGSGCSGEHNLILIHTSTRPVNSNDQDPMDARKALQSQFVRVVVMTRLDELQTGVDGLNDRWVMFGCPSNVPGDKNTLIPSQLAK